MDPPWSFVDVACNFSVPKLPAKRTIPAAEARFLVLDHLSTMYHGHLQVYTDGSVCTQTDSCAAAFCIPCLGVSWSGRLDRVVSSTTVESAAITAALRKLRSFSARDVVVLTDSKSALQRLHRGLPQEKFTRQSLALIKQLIGKSFNIKFQWIPSHVGIEGNEKADALACEARTSVPKVRTPKTYQNNKDAIRNHFKAIYNFPHQACVTHGLPREQATLLYRIRTGSAYTPAWSFKTGRYASPFCAFCGDIGDIEHFIWLCPQFDVERAAMVRNLQKGCHRHRTVEDVIFPEGPAATRRKGQRIVIAFAKYSDSYDAGKKMLHEDNMKVKIRCMALCSQDEISRFPVRITCFYPMFARSMYLDATAMCV